MGTWGAGLYSDDTTCEVRDEFKAGLERGLSHAQAEQAILDRFGELLRDHQIACLVYFALADTQWRFGCLSEATRRRAVELLQDGGDLGHWEAESPSDAKARARTLASLAARLATPQPAPKPVKVRPVRPPRRQVGEPVGTVFGLPLPDGRMAVLKFVGLRPVGQWEEAVFRLLPWRRTGMPSASELEPVCGEAVPVCGHHEFSILIDRRKKMTAYLTATGVVLPGAAVLDESRFMAIGVEALPKEVQDALGS